ncbi:hypothetical protein L227DRAFT_574555 [Lentinus tigrinus ALCF2SS1-6]|uniref:Uncharacterized protein n=1 Tax=Lentinus tigrinus ALCF2SS1-6 TaxID=1328759 RepID=A0A5C2SEB0_9APHY|nr:hypothetical protein L227DRAFT_574555 [Lentinus tigrinus ALCF2SS1-6]
MSAYEKQSYSGMEDAIFPSFFHGKCLDDDGNTPPGCPNPDCPVVCGTPGSMVHFYSKLRYIAFNQTYHLLEALAAPGSDTYQKVEDMVMAAAKQSPQKRRIYSRVFPRGYAGAPVNAMQNNQQGSSAPVPPVPAPGSGSHMAHAPGAGAPAAGEDALPGSRAGSSHQPAVFSELLSGDSGLSSLSSKNSNGLPLPGLKRRSQDIKAGLRSILQQIYSLLQQRCGGDGEGNTNGLADCSWEEEMKEYILSFP